MKVNEGHWRLVQVNEGQWMSTKVNEGQGERVEHLICTIGRKML